MFQLSSATIDSSSSFSASILLSGFTGYSGSLSRLQSFRAQRVDTPSSNPMEFSKLYTAAIQGSPSLDIDLTNITLADGTPNQSLTLKGVFIFAQWQTGESGVVGFSKGATDGYTGAYRLDTNVYVINELSQMLLLFGQNGNPPASNNRTLSVYLISGDSPQSVHIILWGD